MLNMILGTSTSHMSGFQIVAAVLACVLFAFILLIMFGVSWYDVYLQKMEKEILINPQSIEKAYKKESMDKYKVRLYVKFKKGHKLYSQDWVDVTRLRYQVEEVLRKVGVPLEIDWNPDSELPN